MDENTIQSWTLQRKEVQLFDKHGDFLTISFVADEGIMSIELARIEIENKIKNKGFLSSEEFTSAILFNNYNEEDWFMFDFLYCGDFVAYKFL